MQHILIVDDEAVVLKLTKIILEKQGYKTSAYSCPQEALQSIGEEDHFDLIISDLIMPIMRGDKFIEKIHQQRPDLPAIIISASNDLKKLEESGLPINITTLHKPFHYPELIELVIEKIP